MKKFYYITIVATLAILWLQIDYINSLYKDYIYRVSVDINDSFQTAISRELSYRDYHTSPHYQGKPWRENLYMKWAEDMTPHEIDSLMKISKQGESINIDEARKVGVGKTSEEISRQLTQDRALIKGNPVDLYVLDSLFIDSSEELFKHTILLYGKNKTVIDSTSSLHRNDAEYISDLIPIGTKGLQWVQLKVEIPRDNFIERQLLTLILSAWLMVIVIVCLLFQLIGIRRRNELLLKRETSVSGLIHDLKTPLNNVVTLLSWIKSTEPDTERKELISEGQNGLKRLINNIESLLVTARKDKQKIILNPTEIDLLEITEWVKSELDNIYQEKSHTIEIINRLPADCNIFADAMYIENVIRNLMENSLKYSNEGVNIIVTLEKKDKVVIISVKDNGWGIPSQYQKKLFTQFYQVPRGIQNQKGYGIGLAHVRNIIEEHRGKIKMVSKENEGSTFSVSFPLI